MRRSSAQAMRSRCRSATRSRGQKATTASAPSAMTALGGGPNDRRPNGAAPQPSLGLASVLPRLQPPTSYRLTERVGSPLAWRERRWRLAAPSRAGPRAWCFCGGGESSAAACAASCSSREVSMTAPSPSSRRRSPATLPGYTAGRAPRNKGRRYPADPPRVEEIIAVMRAAGAGLRGARLRGLLVVLWRAGLRIHERCC